VGDIIGLANVAGIVDAVPGVLTTTRVTPFDVTTVVVVRPSELTCGGDGIALVFGVAIVIRLVVAPGVVTVGVATP
jgi:hypothetical protein